MRSSMRILTPGCVEMSNAVRTSLLMLAITFALAFAEESCAQAKPSSRPEPAPTAWSTLDAGHQRILAPLEKEWNSLPASQQQRLVATARRYPNLKPIQQERFQERITDWAKLTPEQRNAARDVYKDLSRLPPEKQHELRQKWQAKKAQRTEVEKADSEK